MTEKMEHRKGYLDEQDYWLYRGHFITRLWPSGYYETYTGGRFKKADTKAGIMAAIDRAIHESLED